MSDEGKAAKRSSSKRKRGTAKAPRYYLYCHVSEFLLRYQIILHTKTTIMFIERYARVLDELNRALNRSGGRLLLFWEGGCPGQGCPNGWQALLDQLAWLDQDAAAIEQMGGGAEWMSRQANDGQRRSQQIASGFSLKERTVYQLDELHRTHAAVHVLTPWDLGAALCALGAREGGRLFRWFLGPGGESTYDSPKVPEAMVRIKLLGSGTPVLRIDWDALVQIADPERVDHVEPLVRSAEAVVHRHAELRRAGHAWFAVSGGYRADNSVDPASASGAIGAYATRVFPALRKTTDLMKLVVDDDRKEVATSLIDAAYEPRSFHAFLDGLATMGPDKDHSVISGALLTLSTACIVDSPPFAGLSVGVLWIDDYLKCALHKALHHIPFGSEAHGRVPGAEVRKARPPIFEFGRYVLGRYIPTVVLGAVVDRWIFGVNRPDRADCRYDVQKGIGVLPRAIRRATARGDLDPRASQQLARTLKDEALVRLGELRASWMADLKGTFAGAWASGELRDEIPDISNALSAYQARSANASVNLLRFGMLAPRVPDETPLHTWEQVNPALVGLIDDLVDDMLDYIALCCHWGEVVQSVRNADEDPRRLGSLVLPGVRPGLTP